MYIYLLWKVVDWFMMLDAPTMEQAGLVSVIVGAGAAWFGLYVNSTSTKFSETSFTSRPGSINNNNQEQQPDRRTVINEFEK